MNKILPFVAGFLLTFASFTACAGPERMNPYSMLAAQQELAWRIACEAKEADCTLITAPKVGWSLMKRNEFGYYEFGSRTVVINLGLMLDDAGIAVMVHEMIHFLQEVESPAESLTRRQWCAREEEAFRLSYEMNLKYRLTDNTEVAPPWAERVFGYGCLFSYAE